MAKKTVTVTRDPKDDAIAARVDEQVLVFNAAGQAQIDVEPGMHVLTYIVVLPPGTKVTLAITTPPEAKWSRTQTVPADGVIAGAKKFTVA